MSTAHVSALKSAAVQDVWLQEIHIQYIIQHSRIIITLAEYS